MKCEYYGVLITIGIKSDGGQREEMNNEGRDRWTKR